MKKDFSILNNFTFLYLYISTIIFLFGWCKYIISIPLSLLLTTILIKEFINNKSHYSIKNLKAYISDNKKQIIIILIISIIYVLLSGIGGYVYQNYDHDYRNSILKNLVNNNWPIVEKSRGIFFSYYFAFWLPAAAMGKLFGLKFAYFFLYIWSVVGIFITFNYVKKYYKGCFLIPILIFIIFSGLDILEEVLNSRFYISLMDIKYALHIEWAVKYQFSSFTTQLFWVFNQCIPAWLLTFYILSLKNNRIIGILISISLIFCTLPTFGLAIIALYKIFYDNGIKNRDITSWLKHTFTWENILVGIPLLLVLGAFVKSNASGGVIEFGVTKSTIMDYFISVIFEFGIYYLVLFKYNKKKPLFYISFITLLLCPLISINGAKDFCMRASIPCLLILFIYVLDAISESYKKKDKLIYYSLVIILLIGSVTATNEIRRPILNAKDYQGRKYAALITEDDFGHNFYGYTKDSIFYKYFMR